MVERDAEILAVLEILPRQSWPAIGEHAATIDLLAHRERHVTAAMIGAAVAVLSGVAPEFRDDHDRHAIRCCPLNDVGMKGRERIREVKHTGMHSAAVKRDDRALIDVRIPTAVERVDRLDAHIGLDERGRRA